MLPPELPSASIFGHARAALDGPLPLYAAARELGPIVRIRFGPRRVVVLSDPAAIRSVFIGEYASFSKATPGNRTLSLVFGQGLSTIDHGEAWRRHRRVVQPAFRPGTLAALRSTMQRAADDLVERIRREPRIELHAAMTDVALRIAGETMFGEDVSRVSATIARSTATALDQLIRLTMNPLPWWHRVPTPANRRLQAAIADVDAIVDELVAQRRNAADPGTDLLGLLISAKDEQGNGLDPRELRDEVVTMLMAGHATVAAALEWAVHLLAQAPEVADSLVGLDPAPNPKDGLARVFAETIRLYPPIWLIGRRTTQTVELGRFTLPADTIVQTCAFAVHRHPAFWADPESFVPDRFFAEPVDGAFLPFGLGPRKCIGDRFAELEWRVVIATLTRAFRVQIEDPSPSLVANITLRPRGPLWATFTPR